MSLEKGKDNFILFFLNLKCSPLQDAKKNLKSFSIFRDILPQSLCVKTTIWPKINYPEFGISREPNTQIFMLIAHFKAHVLLFKLKY